jgi:GT2 family glycosyltransferase
MCLGADVLRGAQQKPFDGKLAYDYLMWIDSDVLFTPQQFARLLSHQCDIVAGLYLMEDGKHFAAVRDWDEEHFAKHGSFRFLTPGMLEGEEKLVEVAYTGMGFMLVKQGVFEKLEYPWFKPIEKKIGEAVDFTMEDVSLALRARELGVKVLVDPQVRVGHEKTVVL